MATPPINEQFVGINSSQDLTERGSALTNSARQIYTYADLIGGAHGASQLEASQTTLGLFAGISKYGYTMNLGSFEYDVYNLKGLVPLRPETTSFIIEVGVIEVSEGENIFFINNRTNIEAVDFGGLGGYTNNPINLGAMVDDSTNVARPISVECYINQDNDIGLPPEFNGIYVVAEDSAAFECDAYVDMDFIITKDSDVEFVIS